MPRLYNTAGVFAAACTGMSFFGVSMIILGTLLPLMAEHFSLTSGQTAALTTLLPAGILAGSVIFGPVADRFGHKPLMAAALAALLAGVALLQFAGAQWQLGTGVSLIGLGGGILNGETNALVSDIYDDSRRASRLSLLGIFYGIGALTLPLLLARVATWDDARRILAILIGALAVGILYIAIIRFPSAKCPQGFPLARVRQVASHPLVWLLSGVLFFQSGIESVTNNWSVLVITERLNPHVALTAISCMLVGLTAARLVQVWLLGRFAPRHVLLASLAVAAAGFILLGLALGTLPPAARTPAAYTAMAMVGAGLAATFPVVFDTLGARFADLSGTVFSMALVIALCGQLALNTLMGTMIHGHAMPDGIHYTGTALFAPLMAAAVTAMFILLSISKRKPS